MSAVKRLRDRVADAYWEARYRFVGRGAEDPERTARLVARLDQVVAERWPNRDWTHHSMCDASGCRHGCCQCMGAPWCTPAAEIEHV